MKIYQRACVIGLAVLLALSLFCAMIVQVDAAQDRPLKIWYHNENGHVQTYNLVDDITGVNYVVVTTERGNGELSCAITPRLNADGSLYVTP